MWSKSFDTPAHGFPSVSKPPVTSRAAFSQSWLRFAIVVLPGLLSQTDMEESSKTFRPQSLLFGWLINPDVVDLEALGPDGGVDALLTAPRSTDRQVQEKVKWFVEGPLPVIGGRIC